MQSTTKMFSIGSDNTLMILVSANGFTEWTTNNNHNINYT